MSKRQRILLVGLNYAPEHTGIAPYTAGLARELASGYDVQVLTTHPHYPDWSIAPGYGEWLRDEVIDGVRVRRLRHFVPGSPTGLSRILSEASFALRVAATRLAPADLLLSVSPALLSVASAHFLSQRWRAPLGVVVQDLYGRAVSEVGLLGRATAPVTRVEGALLRRATGVVAIHPNFTTTMSRDLGISPERVTVIPNWTHIDRPTQSREVTRARLGWGRETVVLHAGNMGAKQGLDHVVDFAQELGSRQQVRVVLLGNGSQRAHLGKRAQEVPNLDLMDPVPDSEFSEVLAAADILLLHEKPGVVEMCVPSKLTSYFAAGRPVLAATHAKGAAALEVHKAQAGLVVTPGSTSALRGGLDQLLEQDFDQLGANGRIYAEESLAERAALDAYSDWVESLLSSRIQPNL